MVGGWRRDDDNDGVDWGRKPMGGQEFGNFGHLHCPSCLLGLNWLSN